MKSTRALARMSCSNFEDQEDAGTTPKDEASIDSEDAGGAAAAQAPARQLLLPPLELLRLLPRRWGGACSCACGC